MLAPVARAVRMCRAASRRYATAQGVPTEARWFSYYANGHVTPAGTLALCSQPRRSYSTTKGARTRTDSGAGRDRYTGAGMGTGTVTGTGAGTGTGTGTGTSTPSCTPNVDSAQCVTGGPLTLASVLQATLDRLASKKRSVRPATPVFEVVHTVQHTATPVFEVVHTVQHTATPVFEVVHTVQHTRRRVPMIRYIPSWLPCLRRSVATELARVVEAQHVRALADCIYGHLHAVSADASDYGPFTFTDYATGDDVHVTLPRDNTHVTIGGVEGLKAYAGFLHAVGKKGKRGEAKLTSILRNVTTAEGEIARLVAANGSSATIPVPDTAAKVKRQANAAVKGLVEIRRAANLPKYFALFLIVCFMEWLHFSSEFFHKHRRGLEQQFKLMILCHVLGNRWDPAPARTWYTRPPNQPVAAVRAAENFRQFFYPPGDEALATHTILVRRLCPRFPCHWQGTRQ